MVNRTHFGSKTVDADDKQSLVEEVFHSSAQNYDIMNDLMSAGMHRIWKEEAVRLLQLSGSEIVCDVAAGSGDLTKKILRKCQRVYMTDINSSMLNLGYNRILDECVDSMKLSPVLANAESLPFANKAFDRMICGFGIRNMTNMDIALSEFYRCLKPGGRLVILEFSKVKPGPLNDLYQIYSQNVIPTLGSIFAKDRESYQYLVDSINNHPNQEQFSELMQHAGFSEVAWHNQSFGAVAIHVGIKL